MPARRLTRWTAVATAVVAATALSGCSQVSGIVEQILPERSNVHVLVPGDCFNNTVSILTSESEVIDVPRENCTLEHDNEVIASIQLEGEAFPGDDELLLQGFQVCLPEFEEFIGVGHEDAGTLEYDFFAPTEESWALGDREILCFAYDSAAPTAFSLKGRGAERLATPEPDAAAEGDA